MQNIQKLEMKKDEKKKEKNDSSSILRNIPDDI
jgi:hypothetical protein